MTKDNKRCRILIIEDNPGDLNIVEEFLAEQFSDLVIVHAGDFKQAAGILSGDSLFDVILLDLTLPDKNGLDLITSMLDIALLCPIIILTGYADIDFSTYSISQGISDYLIKDDLSVAILFKSITYSIERKKILLHLEESEKRYSDLFHLSPQPMWLCESRTFQVLDVNRAAMVHYGYGRDEFLTMRMSELCFTESGVRRHVAGEDANEPDRDVLQGIYKHKKKNGEYLDVDVNCSIILLKGKEAALILANDITERTKHMEAIERQNDKLRQIAWIQSHAVRAPLARMMGIVGLIGKQKHLFAEQGDLLASFVSSAEELDNVIREISTGTEGVTINSN